MLSPLAATRVLSPLAVGARALAPTLEDVVWTSIVNCAVDAPNTLRSTTAGAWVAGAVSTRAILSGAGYVESTVGVAGHILGLSKGNSGVNWTDLDYGMYKHASGTAVYWVEYGVFGSSFTNASPGDTFRLAVDASGVVTYLVNGIVRRTSPTTAAWPLLLDSAFSVIGATIVAPKIYGLLGASGY